MSDDKKEELKAKVFEISQEAISSCHKHVTSGKKLPIKDLREILAVVREAWFLIIDPFASLSDEELRLPEELDHKEEDDDNPFGLA